MDKLFEIWQTTPSTTRELHRGEVVAKAELMAEERVLNALVGDTASQKTRDSFREKLRGGELDDREIELELLDHGSSGMPTLDIPGMPGTQMGMINLNDIMGKAFGERTRTQRMTVSESYKVLVDEESDKLVDEDRIVRESLDNVAQNGIVFLDEIDQVCARSDRHGADVSREGVQRDLYCL